MKWSASKKGFGSSFIVAQTFVVVAQTFVIIEVFDRWHNLHQLS